MLDLQDARNLLRLAALAAGVAVAYRRGRWPRFDRPRPVTLLIAGIVAVAVLAGPLRADSLPDFDLYYLGGAEERAGTYTDTSRILARAADVDANPVRDDVFRAPPLVALVFQPLSFLPVRAARAAWVVTSALVLLLACVVVGGRGWVPWWLALMAFASLLRGRDGIAGVLLGVATTLKLYPAFLLVPLAAARRWRAL